MSTARIIAALPLPLSIDDMTKEGRKLRAVFGDGLTMSQRGEYLVFRTPGDTCRGCATCHDRDAADMERLTGDWWQTVRQMMILCPDCGNKRCPRATYHGHDCTGSNEPGQEGSEYA